MTHKVIVTEDALRDLRRLHDSLSARDSAAAVRATGAIRAAIRTLANRPDRRAPIYAGLRQLTVQFGRHGYVVRYDVIDDTVTVMRIWHGRENRPT